MRALLFAVAGFVAGVGAHAAWSAFGHSSPARPPAFAGVGTVVSIPLAGSAAGWQPVRSEVQQAVRDSLREGLPGALRVAMAGGAIVPAIADTSDTEESKQARAAEVALTDAAIHAGRWTDDDVARLRSILPKMSAADRPKALAGISKAINEGRLKVVASIPF